MGAIVTSAASAAPPANDNFSAAQTVGPVLPVTVPASNVDATAEVGEPDIFSNAVSASVWYRWIAPAATTAVVDLCQAGFDGSSSPFEKIAVRTGASLLAQVLVAETSGRCLLRFNAVGGTTYNIQVDYGPDQGNFTFRLRNLAPPANDNFASRTVVNPNLPVTVPGTNLDSGWEAGEPAALGGVSQSRSIWYSWTPATSGRVRIDTCQKNSIVGASNQVMVVYTGNTLGTLASVTQSNNCEFDFTAVAGTPYAIAYSGTNQGEMNFLLSLSAAPPPPNDDFANATVIGPQLPVTAVGDNDFATTEAGEPGHGGIAPANKSVWYRWTPTTSGPTRIRGCSRDYDARVSVYTGAAVGALTRVGEEPGFSPHCSIILDAVAGTTYSIAVGGGPFIEQYGPFELDVHRLQVPGNDNLDQAVNLGQTVPFSRSGSTVDATYEQFEPGHDYGYGTQTPSVWYRWTAPSDVATIFQACGSTERIRIAVYSGTSFEDMTKLVAADEGCAQGQGGRLAIAPVQGTTYLIAVAAAERDFESEFTISGEQSSRVVIKPPNAKPRFNLKRAIAKCRKQFKGKGAKAKRKRARCIRAAKRKAAVIKCKKLKNGKARARCIKKARKRFK